MVSVMRVNVDVLIAEVTRRPALWDKQHKHHHNRYVLDREWNEISRILNIPRITARKKWKNLRGKFRSLLAAIPNPKNGEITVNHYDGEWKYFGRLLFLKDQFVRKQDSIDDVFIEEDWTNVEDATSDEIAAAMKCEIEEGTVVDDQSSSQVSPISSECAMDSSAIRFKRGNSQVVATAPPYVTAKRFKKHEEENENLNFFKSLLPQVKSLSAMDKLDYRIKIIKLTQEFMAKGSNEINVET